MAIRSSPHVLHTCIARISGRRLLHVALCKLTAIKHASELEALTASHNHVEVLHIPRLARVRKLQLVLQTNERLRRRCRCLALLARTSERLTLLPFVTYFSPPFYCLYSLPSLFLAFSHTYHVQSCSCLVVSEGFRCS